MFQVYFGYFHSVTGDVMVLYSAKPYKNAKTAKTAVNRAYKALQGALDFAGNRLEVCAILDSGTPPPVLDRAYVQALALTNELVGYSEND
jgi:hypothetical protein